MSQSGFLSPKLKQALWRLDEQLLLAVIGLLHYLWHIRDVMPLCAVAPLRIIMNYQEVWRTQALLISGLDLQRCIKRAINSQLIIKPPLGHEC